MPRSLKSLAGAFALLLATQLFADSAFWTAHLADSVQWRRWNDDTLQASKAADRPLFFFVGHYGNSLARSMLGETFQNKTIANTLNDTAIPILVDVNEEPELAALLGQMALEHYSANELPTCLWTDSELAPLNGGGYFPPTDDWGGQGFLSVARNVAEQWSNNRPDYLAAARERLQRSLATQALPLDRPSALSQVFTPETFSIREAPTLSALALYNTARSVELLPSDEADAMLAAMSQFLQQVTHGAGFDSIEGGFFIGSNDPNWKLPLFQKSTIDQGYLLLALAALHPRDPKPEYKFLMELTAGFIEKTLTKENKLALQYLDSFSAGETPDMPEGSYYLVARPELAELSPSAIEAWGLSPEGNLDENTDVLGIYQGLNVPFAQSPDVLSHSLPSERNELHALRKKKTPPLSDQTGYTATNALLARALAKASESLDEAKYRQQADKLFQATLAATFDPSAKKLYNSDQRTQLANSNDYAQAIAAALALASYENGSHYFDTARAIYETWKQDNRFQPNLLARQIGIEERSYSIAQDSLFESPLALYLEHLPFLEDAPEPLQQDLLQALPGLVVERPQSARSLHRWTHAQAPSD
ncbi:DUF255 domain-containing protein [Pelagicoccus sp. SDUM812005]|uniref:DUF255 domain-containing protein n=1 Tax=Pelagicoccus sp. SDUM812005 TaxID=3041257 RepID=UPI00280F3F6C|nr:DUF255 domain-containing protein [Pelagicoccus sp. SDUM812005]MDQ8182027.1 DUF255 domain-containing protein [Pelagicoccus sp. SDUM812005]